MSLPNQLTAQPHALLHNFKGKKNRERDREKKDRVVTWLRHGNRQIDLLFRSRGAVRRNVASQRHVRHWGERLLSAGRYLFAHTRANVRTRVPIERLAPNWTHVTRNDARWLLRLEWKNVRVEIARRREEGRDKSDSVAVLISSKLLFIFTAVTIAW